MVRSLVAKGVAQHTNPVPNGAIHRGVLCTSGILGKDPETDTYPAGVEAQAALCFEYLDRILAEGGATRQDVVKLDLYLADKNDRSVINRFWLQFWPDEQQRPARQAHIAELPDGCLVQLVAMAVVQPG